MSLPSSFAGLFNSYVFESIDEERHASLELLFVDETQREKTTGASEWRPRRLATRHEAR